VILQQKDFQDSHHENKNNSLNDLLTFEANNLEDYIGINDWD
jgi:hypothetical protein